MKTTPRDSASGVAQPPRKIKKGKRIGILGFSASGKTVFLSMLYHISAERADFGEGDWFIDWHSNDGGQTVKYLRELSNKILGLSPSNRIIYKDSDLKSKVDRRFPDGTNITSHLTFKMIKKVGLQDVPLDVETQDVKGDLLQDAVGDMESLNDSQKRSFGRIIDFCARSKILIIFHNALQKDIIHDRGSLMMLISKVLERKSPPKAIAFAVTGADIFASEQEIDDYQTRMEEKYAGVLGKLEQAGVHYRFFMISSLGCNMTRKKSNAELSPQCQDAKHICSNCQELTDEPGVEPSPKGFEELFDYVFRQISPVYARVPLFATITAMFKKLPATLFGRWYSLLIWMLVAAVSYGLWSRLESNMAESINSFGEINAESEALFAVQQSENYTRWFRSGNCPQADHIIEDWRDFAPLLNCDTNSADISRLRATVSELRSYAANSQSDIFDNWAEESREELDFRADQMKLQGETDGDKIELVGMLLDKWSENQRLELIETQAQDLLSTRLEKWRGSLSELQNAETELAFLQLVEGIKNEKESIKKWGLREKDEHLNNYSELVDEAYEWKQAQGSAVIEAAYQRERVAVFRALDAEDFVEAASLAEEIINNFPDHDGGELSALIKFCRNMDKARRSMQSGEHEIAIKILADEMAAGRIADSDAVVDRVAEGLSPGIATKFEEIAKSNTAAIDLYFQNESKEMRLEQGALQSEHGGLDLLQKQFKILKELQWLVASAKNLEAKEAIADNRRKVLEMVKAGESRQAAAWARETLRQYEAHCAQSFSDLAEAVELLSLSEKELERGNWPEAIELVSTAAPIYTADAVAESLATLRKTAYDKWADDLLVDYAQATAAQQSLLLKYAANEYENSVALKEACAALNGDELIAKIEQSREALNKALSRAESRKTYDELPQIPSRADRCSRKELLSTKQSYQRFLESPKNSFLSDEALSSIAEIDRMLDEQKRWELINGTYTSQMTRSDRQTLMNHCRDYLAAYPNTTIEGEIKRIVYNLENWELAICRLKVVDLPHQYRKLESITVKVRSVPSGRKDGGKLLAEKTFKIKNGKIGGIFENTEIEARWDPDRDLLISFEFTNEYGYKNEASQLLAIRDYRNRIGKQHDKSIKYADGIKTEIEIDLGS